MDQILRTVRDEDYALLFGSRLRLRNVRMETTDSVDAARRGSFVDHSTKATRAHSYILRHSWDNVEQWVINDNPFVYNYNRSWMITRSVINLD